VDVLEVAERRPENDVRGGRRDEALIDLQLDKAKRLIPRIIA
jgi:hypothetical protein